MGGLAPSHWAALRSRGGDGFALQIQEVDVFANALRQGGAGVLFELALQVGDGFGAFAAGGEDLGMNLDGRADGGRQPGIVIELLPDQETGCHFVGFGGEGVGAIGVFGFREGRACKPGEGGCEFGRGGVAGADTRARGVRRRPDRARRSGRARS